MDEKARHGGGFGRVPGGVLTVREVGAALALSPATVYRRLADGSLPTIRIGGSVRVPASAIRELIEPEQEAV